MKRLLSSLLGLGMLVAASGCCCDGCNWGCCNPCRSCSSPCSDAGYGVPPPPAVSAYPGYYGSQVASVPLESLPTY